MVRPTPPGPPFLPYAMKLAVDTLTSDKFADGDLGVLGCQDKLSRLPDSTAPQGFSFLIIHCVASQGFRTEAEHQWEAKCQLDVLA